MYPPILIDITLELHLNALACLEIRRVGPLLFLQPSVHRHPPEYENTGELHSPYSVKCLHWKSLTITKNRKDLTFHILAEAITCNPKINLFIGILCIVISG